MSGLTTEQQSVVDAPMVPLCVIACAGSGKTMTAVHRVVRMRRNLGETRGRVALLSFSNVAVETFRKAYAYIGGGLPPSVGRSRVDIDTLDSFLTTHVVRPHGHRTMKCPRSAFLVTGDEAFLEGFKVKTTSFPQPIKSVRVSVLDGCDDFFYVVHAKRMAFDASIASKAILKLARTGAYTHDLGRYWAYRTLTEQPKILSALARRYPHIVIDEAQDIGSLHQAILELLINAGVCVTLIGDPNQAIYEFAGADGKFLSGYHQRPGIQHHVLERNFRSVPSIVGVANSLCGRGDIAERSSPAEPHGAFFTGFKRGEHNQLITAFQAAMSAAHANTKQSAVLCRAKELAKTIGGDGDPGGQGLVKLLVEAAMLRDQRKDFSAAFQRVAVAIVAMLEDAPPGLVSQIAQSSSNPGDRALRRAIWAFTRDPITGLPSAFLAADTKWHPQMLKNVKDLLAGLKSDCGFQQVANLGMKLSKKSLPSKPLFAADSTSPSNSEALRVDTVHKAKGESLDAVLYITTKDHAADMLAGVGNEVGRIGYVAATRARNLLWVAVPQEALESLRGQLVARGLTEARWTV